MRILFSPVGTADPMTRLGDGPMLHIVRHCRPDRVVLFLSPKMAEFHRRDDRYARAIRLITSEEGRDYAIETVCSDYTKVYRFDHYIDEFERILRDIAAAYPEAELLVNVSSGTPAMKQALFALGAFGEIDLTMLQVPTPKGGVNEGDDRENPETYDFDFVWEWNRECCDNSADRVEVVKSPHFALQLAKGHIRRLVEEYDYEAALVLAREARELDGEALALIEAARDRLNLSAQLPCRVFAGTPLAYRRNDVLSEYLQVMEVRLAQGQYAEFVRAWSPALTAIMKDALAPFLPESRYLLRVDGELTNEIDYDGIEGEYTLRRIVTRNGTQRPKYLTNGLLMELISEYCDEDARIEKIRMLREAEYNCRNVVAHEMTCTNRRAIERHTGGLTFETIMAYFHDLHPGFEPGLYDRINEMICEQL